MYCDEENIRESAGTIGERFKDYLKTPSCRHYHQSATSHPTNLDNFNIVSQEGQGFGRLIMKYICIRVNKSTLNRNTGKNNLPHIWDGVLINTTEL